jgi:hypothetical protein
MGSGAFFVMGCVVSKWRRSAPVAQHKAEGRFNSVVLTTAFQASVLELAVFPIKDYLRRDQSLRMPVRRIPPQTLRTPPAKTVHKDFPVNPNGV